LPKLCDIDSRILDLHHEVLQFSIKFVICDTFYLFEFMRIT